MKDSWKWRRDNETMRLCEEYFAERRAYFKRMRERPTASVRYKSDRPNKPRPHGRSSISHMRGMSDAALSMHSFFLGALSNHGF